MTVRMQSSLRWNDAPPVIPAVPRPGSSPKPLYSWLCWNDGVFSRNSVPFATERIGLMKSFSGLPWPVTLQKCHSFNLLKPQNGLPQQFHFDKFCITEQGENIAYYSFIIDSPGLVQHNI